MYFNKGEYTTAEFDRAYQLIREHLTTGMEMSKNRHAIVLGGQPGAGKSTFYQMRDDLRGYIAINGDEFRRFHPNYIAITRNAAENYAPATQPFCNQVVEKLIADLGSEGYNLIIEGTLRNPDVPIRTCLYLREQGYHTELAVVACDARKTWESTLVRAQVQKENGMFPRLVPIDIYDYIVHTIPHSLAKIEEKDCFNRISLVDREGCILHENTAPALPASEALSKVLQIDKWDERKPSYELAFKQLQQEFYGTRLGKVDTIEVIR